MGLTIQGDRFFLNGLPIKMWGARLASASQTDQLTEHLIAQLDDYVSVGFNSMAVYLAGSNVHYCDPFSPDGKRIVDGHGERMIRIADECGQRGIVLVAGIFYQRSQPKLVDANAMKQAVRTVTELLRPYRNVIINIANEPNYGLYKDTHKQLRFKDYRNIAMLCDVVHEVDPSRIVGSGGFKDEYNCNLGNCKEVDTVLFDMSDKNHHIATIYDRFISAGVTNKPFVCVGAFGGTFSQRPGIFSEEMKQAYYRTVEETLKIPAMSLFFFQGPWLQSIPIHYELGGQGTNNDPGIRWFYEYVQRRVAETQGRGGNV